MGKTKISVILFNLGGPDAEHNIKPFLFNLFYDRAILNYPNPWRWLLAKLISTVRTNKAKAIYKPLGGKSPILEQTQAQALELMAQLQAEYDTQVLVAMRYWHPFSESLISEIIQHGPEELILLPLYPHFSTTTTKSSIDDFLAKLPEELSGCKKRIICCYPTEPNFILAHSKSLQEALPKTTNARILFSAHSLPESIIQDGDPYAWQIKRSCEAIIEAVGEPGLDWQLCYQSKIGPVKWLGPSTEEAIKNAAAEQKNIILVPISFVSEHSETLIELDIQYKELADAVGIQEFLRIPTLQIEELFIYCLQQLCKSVLQQKQNAAIAIYSYKNDRICPNSYCKCINVK